ncbi:hypothetical protein V8G54_021492 [Vigna mungo]|uniref:Uncharacterized protein n=1 Tax=Vigna mungo TaxID=3915 RepID=A0AAQ3RXQ4_VIGMU
MILPFLFFLRNVLLFSLSYFLTEIQTFIHMNTSSHIMKIFAFLWFNFSHILMFTYSAKLSVATSKDLVKEWKGIKEDSHTNRHYYCINILSALVRNTSNRPVW